MGIEGFSVAIVSILLSAFLTAVVGILLKRSFDKFFQKRDKEIAELNQLREEKALEERKDFKQDMIKAIEEAVEPIKQDLVMIKRGTQAGLRHDLSMMADEWLTKGYCPRNVKDDFDNIYTQYHQLGRNGVMDNIYQSILCLPETKVKSDVSVSKRITTSKKPSTTILNG